MSLTIRWLLAIMLLLSPALEVAASETRSRTTDYAWILFHGKPCEPTTTTYDFEHLIGGYINGQCGWVEAETNATIMTDTAVNGTKVVRPNTTVGGEAGQAEMSRVNDENFSFASIITTDAEISFDATGDDNAIFALGQDINGDGMLSIVDNEIGVPFGFWERLFIIFRGNSLTVRAGDEKPENLNPDNEKTDWYRMRLRIDFAANGGDGSGSLAYMNLSNGETSFTDIPTMQNLNLRLLGSGAPGQADWNAMFLLLRTDATNIPKADNLIPNAPPADP